jgi:hypothetical protein
MTNIIKLFSKLLRQIVGYARLEKHLYGVFFEKKIGKILLVETSHGYYLPGGGVLSKDIHGFGMGWKRTFFCRVVPDQIGASAYSFEDKIQDMSANYEAYVGRKEYAAIIICEMYAYQATKAEAKFYSFQELEKFYREGKIEKNQALLASRAFVSRDCPNKEYREQAIPLLKELLK